MKLSFFILFLFPPNKTLILLFLYLIQWRLINKTFLLFLNASSFNGILSCVSYVFLLFFLCVFFYFILIFVRKVKFDFLQSSLHMSIINIYTKWNNKTWTLLNVSTKTGIFQLANFNLNKMHTKNNFFNKNVSKNTKFLTSKK